MEVPQGTKLQIFLITYFLFISLVPGSPSYYRLLVDTVGTQLSLLSLGFLELYLNSRPLNQQNILNSQLHLIVYVQLAFTIREWMASVAGSMFRNITMIMLNSCPGVLMTLLDPRHYGIGLVTAYCTLTVSKLILIISPVTFQNISSSQGFWFSLLAVLLVPLVERILNLIKCGELTTEVEDPFFHAMMIRDELGMTNFVFGGATGNVTASEEDSEIYVEETKFCAYFPTFVFVVIVMVTLEIIKFIILLILERRKINIKINNSNSLPDMLHNIHENPEFNNSAHHSQPVRATPEVVLNPAELGRDSAVQSSNIIYVRPAPADESIATMPVQTTAPIEDRASVVYLTAPITETNIAPVISPAAATLAASAVVMNSAAAEETPAWTKEIAASTKTIRDTSLSGTIKNTLNLIFFRAGTLSLLGFIMCIVTLVPINVYIKDKDLPFFPELLIIIARYFAFFLPLAWVLFDRDIRVYTFLKLRSLWQRYFI